MNGPSAPSATLAKKNEPPHSTESDNNQIQTRQLMENELLELWSANRKSVIFITHDLEEAISLSDRVVVLSAGPATHPIGEFPIDLPRPRDVAEIRTKPRFIELYDRIWHSMKEEVLKGYAQTRNRVRA